MSDDGVGGRGPTASAEEYHAMHDWSSDEPLSFSVVRAVSRLAEKEPEALPPLYDVVDPDSLDTLFTDRTNRNGSLSFLLDGHEVTVYADGGIVVERADANYPSGPA
ncbi:hypothetical protein SAMN04488063_0952 [Halopelagius inordinatus]|uniref:Halobacterial output domain-containing protein n=1 Tax=Halopelagius inordinatus TaxID=553467 RepID=A0A1I2N4Z6_9EURY|nr:HalOD1 output domain-containing protein [Halopelagius inordinatus]SFF96471.1 hypothetical protein SAMN04488063_0952 [Halopelagius inordinatus]